MNRQKTGFQPLAFTLTVLAALLRLAPHPPNFTPIGGVALFGGARLRGWQAYLVPILAMIVTDPIRSRLEGNFAAYSWGTLIVYSCFIVNVFLGRFLLRHSSSVLRIGSVALLGSLQFYLLTNFASWWIVTSIYPHTWTGLVTCYVAALPFFGRTIAADLFYTGMLFSVYALLSRWAPAEPRQRQLA